MQAVWAMLGLMYVAGSANADALSDAMRRYQQDGHYASLKVMVSHLRKGMAREQVEAMLGPPDLEPAEGSCVYSSDRRVYVKEADRKLTVALLIAYRDATGKVTQELQAWIIEPIGE